MLVGGRVYNMYSDSKNPPRLPSWNRRYNRNHLERLPKNVTVFPAFLRVWLKFGDNFEDLFFLVKGWVEDRCDRFIRLPKIIPPSPSARSGGSRKRWSAKGPFRKLQMESTSSWWFQAIWICVCQIWINSSSEGKQKNWCQTTPWGLKKTSDNHGDWYGLIC